MDKRKKTLFQKTVAVPLIIGAVTAALFFVMMPVVSELFPLSAEKLEIADFEEPLQETAIYYGDEKTDGVVKKSEISGFERNALIGTIEIGGAQLPLVYDADNVSLSGAASVMPGGKYIGETGCAYVYGYKSVIDVDDYRVGQNINVKTAYGTYVFTVSDIKTVSSQSEIYYMNTGVKRGLVLYTNKDNGYGIGSEFDAVVMEMKTGPSVAE